MSQLAVKMRTALALGIPSLLRVMSYRAGVTLRLGSVCRIRAAVPKGRFFRGVTQAEVSQLPAPSMWLDNHSYFGWYQIPGTSAPNWHENPFTHGMAKQPMRPWWQIPDFDEETGDIKTVWEASRYDWVLVFAQQALKGQPEALTRLNAWLSDWLENNPPYYGPNWKCGQEASIRVMHLAVAAVLLVQDRDTEDPLRSLISAHLRRIAPTIQYAIGQDNNHGTSEAAALFIGGSWLAAQGDEDGVKWQNIGRRWLENRAAKLIEQDGSFSQYSVTYHRVMLDTYSMAEYWRRRMNLPKFSPQLYRQLGAAAQWLYQMTQPETGDAPNLGANDGARLLPLGNAEYRDFRPAVQLAMALFSERCAYPGDGVWNSPLRWLGLEVPTTPGVQVGSVQFGDGGYSILRRGKAFALLRFPRFRFRPSQADALHVDFWQAGINLLRDAGTYSYNAGNEALHYFGGVAGHNTVQFDGRDQMPRLGRFLFGDWLKARDIKPVSENGNEVSAAAGYTDAQGAAHRRTVTLTDRLLRVEDVISGFKQSAVLRWRLLPGEWKIEGNEARSGHYLLRISASVPIVRISLAEGWESRYYLKKEPVPVLEVEVRQAGSLITEYQYQ